MGYPAFKLTTGGTATEITTLHLGSDELSEDIRRTRAGVQHQRHGVTIASRTWMLPKIWNININSASQAYMESLRVFFEAGSFILYPDVDVTSTFYYVFWDKQSFDPKYIAPDQYSLQAVIKETTIGAGTPTYIPSQGNQTVNGNLQVNGDLTVQDTLNASVLQSGGTDLSAIFADISHGHAASEITAGTFGGVFTFDSLLHTDYLEAQGNLWTHLGLLAEGDVYINYSGGANDAFLYFYEGTTSGAYLKYDNTTDDDFTLSHPLNVIGLVSGSSLTTDGIIYSGGVDIATLMGAGGGITLDQVEDQITGVTHEVVSAATLYSTGDTSSNGAVNVNRNSGVITGFLNFHDGTDYDGVRIFVNTGETFLRTNTKIAVGGDVECTKLIADTSAEINGGLFMNYDNAASTSAIYFYGDNPADASILFTTGGSKFDVNQGFDVSGIIYSGGVDIATLIAAGGGLSLDDVEDQITGTSHIILSATTATLGSMSGTNLYASNYITGSTAVFDTCTSKSFSNAGGSFNNYGQFDFYGSGIGSYSGLVHTKSMTIVDPQAGDEAPMFKCTRDILITEVVIVGKHTSGTATWGLRYGSDRSAAGSTIKNASTDSFSETVGDTYTTFTNDDPAEGDWLWFEVTATGGTSVEEIHIDVTYRDL